jgi:HEAT repeat protein
MRQIFSKLIIASAILTLSILSYAENIIFTLYEKIVAPPYDTLEPELVKELNELDAESKKALVPYLIESLRTGKKHKSWVGIKTSKAAEALGRIGIDAKEAMPYLLDAIYKDYGHKYATMVIQSSAAIAILRISPNNKQAEEVLINGLKKGYFYPDSRMTDLGASIIPVFAEVIKDKNANYYHRQDVIRAIKEMGLRAEPAIPMLSEQLLKKKYQSEQELKNESFEIANALGRIGQSALPTLIEALKDKRSDIKSSAAYAIKEMGPQAKSAIPTLLKTMDDKDSMVRYYSYLALASAGKGDTKVRSALVKARNKWKRRVFYTKEFFTQFDFENPDPAEWQRIQRAIDELDGIDQFKHIKPKIHHENRE